MRLSVDETDPGYPGFMLFSGVKVRLNGVERKHVFTADEEKRLVVVAATDERGHIRLNADQSEILCETLYGDVYIDMPDEQRKRIEDLRRRPVSASRETRSD